MIRLVYPDKYLFHISHISNLPGILKKGILSKNALKTQRLKVNKDISHSDIQDVRATICIPGTSYVLHDCVPIFFGARQPMLLAVKGKGVASEEIVYVIIKWEIIDSAEVWFTDGNARSYGTSFFQGIAQLNRVDYEAAGAYYWGDKGDEFKRKKQAEVLKLHSIKIEDIVGFLVYNDTAKRIVKSMLQAQNLNKPVQILPGFYYD